MAMVSKMVDTGQTMDVERTLRSVFNRESVPVDHVEQVNSFRIKAWEAFSRKTLPKHKDDWKRVDLTQIPWQNYSAYMENENNRPSDWQIDGIDALAAKGVIAGVFKDAFQNRPEISDKVIGSLIDPEKDIFAAMAAAFASDGLFIFVPTGVKINDPIHISKIRDQARASLYNHLIWLEPGAEAQIILDDLQSQNDQTGSRVSNGNIGIRLGEGAKLKLLETTVGSDQAWKISHEKALLESNSQLEWTIYAVDGRLIKQFIQSDLAGKGCAVQMAGLYLPSGKQQVEFNTRQNHFAANTNSNLLYKGVLLDESQSLFSGMIYVAPGAVKADGYQANRNLIIGANAHADTLPGLEILADDVRCTHGATVGKIDPTELFYLQSRGLEQMDAQKLIIQGFLDPVLQKHPVETERTRLQSIIERKLSVRG